MLGEFCLRLVTCRNGSFRSLSGTRGLGCFRIIEATFVGRAQSILWYREQFPKLPRCQVDGALKLAGKVTLVEESAVSCHCADLE